MNVKELKEFLKDLPDDMHVVSCCGSIENPSVVRLREIWGYHPDSGDEDDVITVVEIH